MCILFTAINQHPDYPVIICANRDEFHQRPTQALHRWNTNDGRNKLIAGKDLQAGGTWLGINPIPTQATEQHVAFSALTNYRQIGNEHEASQYISRGDLVLKALQHDSATVSEYLNQHSQNYQGFNLIYGQLSTKTTTLTCFDSVKRKFIPLNTGFHSICNGALDDVWPKMASGQKHLEAYVNQSSTIDIEKLFSLMKNQDKAPEHLLPKTGLPLEWEQRLSSIFIVSPEYGTRSTCILLMNTEGQLDIHQQEFDAEGYCFNKISFSV